MLDQKLSGLMNKFNDSADNSDPGERTKGNVDNFQQESKNLKKGGRLESKVDKLMKKFQ